jgi:hypothetical protein
LWRVVGVQQQLVADGAPAVLFVEETLAGAVDG